MKYNLKCQNSANQNTGLEIEKYSPDHSKATKTKQVIQEVTTLKQNKITVNCGSVAGAPTTKQKFQDHFVLSNRFQMLQPLVDKQEQEQQISQESPASVHLVPLQQ